MTPDHTPDEEMALVMPFVVCRSQSGPYDDAAFVAGYGVGLLDARLADSDIVRPITQYVAPPLVPQLDLLAMRHGWNLLSEPWDEQPDEWTRVTFTRPEDGVVITGKTDTL